MTKKDVAQRNNLRRYKSAVVYNTFGRSDLADMAKSWSFERIEATLGIKISPKTLYRVPAREKQKAATRATYYDNYIQNNVAGYTVAESFKNRTKKTMPPRFGAGDQMADTGFELSWKRSSRLTDWRKWSAKDKEFPSWIKHHAVLLNREAGMPAESRFGFGVMYYDYVEGWSEDAALAYVKPDKASPLEYRIDSKRKGL